MGGAGGRTVEVLFPSWGSGARITAVSKAGKRRPVTRATALSDIAWFHVESERTGYVVALRKGASRRDRLGRSPRRPVLRSLPGPTLTIKVKATTITARLAPARTAEEARAVASRLLLLGGGWSAPVVGANLKGTDPFRGLGAGAPSGSLAAVGFAGAGSAPVAWGVGVGVGAGRPFGGGA